MRSIRLALPVVVLLLVTTAFAHADAQAPAVPESAAQKSFDAIKALAGTWEGVVKVDPPVPSMEATRMTITMRVTSRGNVLVHEMQEAGTPLDPTRYDHPVTVFYLDGDHLVLTHYCDAGNRPHMEAETSSNAKKVEFDLLDVSGGNKHGHMHHAVFTLIDADHHVEDWTYMLPGDKPMHAHFELHRTK
jgi:hypothetical protein